MSERDGGVPGPEDDDKTVKLRKPVFARVVPRVSVQEPDRSGSASAPPTPPPRLAARRTPPWVILAPLALVTAAAAGGGIAWFRGAGDNAPARALLATPAPLLDKAANTVSANTAPGNTAPANIASGNTASGNTAPGNTTPANTASATNPEPAGPTRSYGPAGPVVAALAPPPAEPTLPAAPPGPGFPIPGFSIETASERRILDHVGSGIKIFRLSVNPRVLILNFASLRDQGRMLNRVAALVEKAGVPRDRVLRDAELDAVVRGGGETTETFYYGHDYGADSVNRFFRLADRDGVPLLGEEETLRRLIAQEGWPDPDTRGALLSIPGIGAHERIDKASRAVILRHELSHGEYFTNPDYAAFVHRFWTQTLTNGERDRMRRHLRAQGYDSEIEELMENEAQAYLMFTQKAEYFTPAMVGMSQSRLNELRAAFHRSMPRGWLRDSLGSLLAEIAKTAATPVAP